MMSPATSSSAASMSSRGCWPKKSGQGPSSGIGRGRGESTRDRFGGHRDAAHPPRRGEETLRVSGRSLPRARARRSRARSGGGEVATAARTLQQLGRHHLNGGTMKTVVLLCVLASPGCSWVLVTKVPAGVHPQAHRHPPCTRAYNPPVADTMVAGALAGVGAVEAGKIGDKQRDGEETAAALVNLGFAAAFALSASYGFGHVTECRALDAVARGRAQER